MRPLIGLAALCVGIGGCCYLRNISEPKPCPYQHYQNTYLTNMQPGDIIVERKK